MVYPHKDKEGRTVIWTRFNRFHKSDLTPMLKQYVVYVFEKCDRETSNQGWAQVLDSNGTGLSNVDMDFYYFLSDVLQTHYPRGPKYTAVMDLPFILNATAKLILAFMNEELKSTVKFITKDELTQYLESCHIPVSLEGLVRQANSIYAERCQTIGTNRWLHCRTNQEDQICLHGRA